MESVLGKDATGSGCDCGDDISNEGLEQFPTDDLVREPLWLVAGFGCGDEWGEDSDEEELEALFKEARLIVFLMCHIT